MWGIDAYTRKMIEYVLRDAAERGKGVGGGLGTDAKRTEFIEKVGTVGRWVGGWVGG